MTVETTVWDLRDERGALVWKSNMERRNPTSTRDFVDGAGRGDVVDVRTIE